MKKSQILFSLALLPALLFLTGCSDQQTPTDAQAQNGQSAEASPDDHHAGETNVAPHDDSQTDDHHQGDENIEDHAHDGDHDDSGQPPHRH